jgi:hypothetical protein
VRNARAVLRQCPYCLGEFPHAQMTDDHVIARSWYPAKIPPIAKWEVRACEICNNKKSALEGDLLGRLALCLDPADPALAGLIEKARRSMDPRSARNAKDFMHRFNRREAMRRSVIDLDSKHVPGLLPYFMGNFNAGSRTGIEVPAQSLDGLVKMWVRGIHLCEIGWIIPSGYQVSVIHPDDQTRAEALSDIIRHAKIVQKGPGVEVAIFHAEEPHEFMTLYAFNIWNTLRCSASVERAQSPTMEV